ncbi:MAG TPA: LysR family transcriptional regulator [Oscillatoriaceae cyanobacterium M33_DOE_052]|uniref:LysR family transcriptional regulator n=1 Tax=Planktothricoides sp. SpSt-374 TaxID=2282167 RepID=A0A7C3ZXA2_9CYAN|nr:LysR family transcriptional regulator [Oscillatoriaceae cyanobacterium M33_DOE_052]
MTLEQLRIFLAVAEYLHFTRAAEALFITQPAVSAAIQCLEAEYGVKLFHRIGRRIEIAEAGKLLQVEAQRIIDQVVQAERGLQELNNLQRGELKLGASLTIGNYWLPSKISQFKRQYPGINIDCTLANAEEICEGTATGIFDLGLLTGGVKSSLESYLDQEVVGSERMQIVVGKSHPWFERPEITVSELAKTDWVMRESGSGVQQMFEQALQSWGVDPSQLNVVLVLPSSDMIKAVVENDMGAAAIPDLMVTKELQLATLRSVTVMPNKGSAQKPLEIVQQIWKLKHRQRFQTKITSVFEEMLRV